MTDKEFVKRVNSLVESIKEASWEIVEMDKNLNIHPSELNLRLRCRKEEPKTKKGEGKFEVVSK